jgi:hypothetical protein
MAPVSGVDVSVLPRFVWGVEPDVGLVVGVVGTLLGFEESHVLEPRWWTLVLRHACECCSWVWLVGGGPGVASFADAALVLKVALVWCGGGVGGCGG